MATTEIPSHPNGDTKMYLKIADPFTIFYWNFWLCTKKEKQEVQNSSICFPEVLFQLRVDIA